MSTRIYVITHKKVELNMPTDYKKLLVGAYRNQSRDKEYIFDDDCNDNISNKNSNYCELTGLYWIWKNDTNDNKGLVHYRRFFTKNRFTNNPSYFYNKECIDKILKEYDVIVSEKLYIDETSVKDDYLVNHKIDDWTKLKDIIKDIYPEYMSAFEMIEKGNWFYPYNMLISRTVLFNKYCDWIFDVLGRLEKEVDLSDYDVQQARIYGFLSERLLAVWLITNNCKVYEAPVIQTDCRFRYRIRRALEKRFKKRITFGEK